MATSLGRTTKDRTTKDRTTTTRIISKGYSKGGQTGMLEEIK